MFKFQYLKRGLIYKFAFLALTCPFPLIAAPKSPQAPVFVNGLAQPVYVNSSIIKEDIYVNAPNGEKIHILVERPSETKDGIKLPVVLRPSPYYGVFSQSDKTYFETVINVDVDALYDGSPGFNNISEVQTRNGNKNVDMRNERVASATKYYLLDRGFVAIQVDSLGTGHSTGCPPMGTVDDGLALSSVIHWLNGRTTAFDANGKQVFATWSTGKAATMGISYNGFLSLALAEATGIPELKTAILMSGPYNWYDYYHSNGSFRDAGGGDGIPEEPIWRGENLLALFEYVLNTGSSSYCDLQRQYIKNSVDHVTGNYNAFWNDRNALNRVNNVVVPTFLYHGLTDDNVRTSQTINLYNKLKSAKKNVHLLLHQGGHETPTLGGDVFNQTLNKIFSQFLFGQNNGVLNTPQVTVQREDKITFNTYSSFPDPQAVNTTFKFSTNGTMSTRGLSSGVATIVDSKDYLDVLINSVDATTHRLIYTTPILSNDIKISGFPILKLKFAITPSAPLPPTATTAAANISAALVKFSADGTYKIITRGWVDPQNRDSLSSTSIIIPNTFYNVTFKLEPNDHVFKAGTQLGVVIYSTDNEFNLSPPPGTIVSIDLSGSSFSVPIVGNIN